MGWQLVGREQPYCPKPGHPYNVVQEVPKDSRMAKRWPAEKSPETGLTEKQPQWRNLLLGKNLIGLNHTGQKTSGIVRCSKDIRRMQGTTLPLVVSTAHDGQSCNMERNVQIIFSKRQGRSEGD